jgi:hypothetical protein
MFIAIDLLARRFHADAVIVDGGAKGRRYRRVRRA